MSVPATEKLRFSAALPARSIIEPRERQVILSPREKQIISLIADGLNSKEIARMLCLAESTVGDHVKAIRAKLRARNRAHAVTIWLHDYAAQDDHVKDLVAGEVNRSRPGRFTAAAGAASAPLGHGLQRGYPSSRMALPFLV